MRTILFTIITLVLISSSFGQTITDPLQLNRNVLVSSAGLPEEYLLFVPDTATQIFFNPARAGSYKGSFVYVNYLSDYNTPLYGSEINLVMSASQVSPGIVLVKGTDYYSPYIYEESYTSTKSPSISVGSLIDCGDAKWLFTLSNGLYSYDTRKDNSIITNYAAQNNVRVESEINNTNSETDASATALKVSYITGKGDNNYSIGIWGVFHNNDTQSDNIYRGESNNIYYYTGSTQISDYISAGNQWLKNDNKQYAAGAEFTINNASMDFISSISYQYNKLPQNMDYYSRYTRADSSFTEEPPAVSYSINDRTASYKGSAAGNTDGITFYTYFSHKLNLITPADNFFASVYAYSTGGDKAYEGNYYSSNVIFSSSSTNVNPVVTELNETGNLKARNKGIIVTAGYALKIRLTDIQVLSGLKVSGKLTEVNDITSKIGTSSYAGFIEYDYKNRTAAIVLPVYLHYTPAQWVSVYGGLNYAYYYNFEKSDARENRLRYSTSDYSYTSTSISSSENERWQSAKSVYLGFQLRHQSGINLQTFFSDNFSNIRNWNISVGYHF